MLLLLFHVIPFAINFEVSHGLACNEEEASLKRIFHSVDRDGCGCNEFAGNIPDRRRALLLDRIMPGLVQQIVVPLLALNRIEPSNNIISLVNTLYV